MTLPRIDFDLDRDERLPVVLLLIFLCALCVAGGASKEEVLGQSVIRGFAVLLMLVQVLAGRLPDLRRYKVCTWLLGSMICLGLIQLVPLPPALWTALPGRETIAASPMGAQTWRPINLVPDAGWNAVFSLLVPLCVLVFLSVLRERTVRKVRFVLLGVVIFSAVLALLQATGNAPDNPLINGSPDEYGGIFANRNHQALFLTIGISLAWFWGFERGGSWRDRRLWLAICMILLLAISLLVTGSRSGALLGALAVVVGPPLALLNSGRRKREGSRSAAFWTVASLIVAGIVIGVSIYFGRAQSLDRATSLSVDDDLRLQALPTVWHIAKAYFPFGAGQGSFDQAFRISEPFAFLHPTYFNHAHNDLLETVIEAGIFGPAILLCGMIWACRGAVSVFAKTADGRTLGRLSVAVIILVFLASISDYPARTPTIMATLMIAGCWLSDATRKVKDADGSSALRSAGKPL